MMPTAVAGGARPRRSYGTGQFAFSVARAVSVTTPPRTRQATRSPSTLRSATTATPQVEATAVPAPPKTAMDAARINQALASILPTLPYPTREHEGTRIHVCEATEDEWDAYVDSEEQLYRARFMEWTAKDPASVATTGAAVVGDITIVELGGAGHDCLGASMLVPFVESKMLRLCLASHGPQHNKTRPKIEPDVSCGPAGGNMEPLGSRLHDGVRGWHEMITLKIEIGMSQLWSSLDDKARFKWSRIPGVEYVLCIKTDDQLQEVEYKLYSIDRSTDGPPALIEDPTPVVAPSTIVSLDSRRLLGLPPNSPLPVNLPGTRDVVLPSQVPAGVVGDAFPDPFEIDLYPVVVDARLWRHPLTAAAPPVNDV